MRRNFAIGAITLYICTSIYSGIVIRPLAETAKDLEKSISKEDLPEEDSEPGFIPLPFTLRQEDGLPYRGSDPEWQAFVKLSKDPESLKRIQS